MKRSMDMQGRVLSRFKRYIGIDYSGAKTSTSGLPGLCVFSATLENKPVVVPPPSSLRKRHWTRKGLAEWLCSELAAGPPTLVGIDHAFSFPQAYFREHGLRSLPAFLNDFQRYWPTHLEGVTIQGLREDPHATARKRTGDAGWMRLTDLRAGGAKSVFRFGVNGQVASSTHAGLPWLRYLREKLSEQVFFWPLDGWDIPAGRSVIGEVYPRLWSWAFYPKTRSRHEHDAYCVTAWLQRSDRTGVLPLFEEPCDPENRAKARLEGWILGVAG